MCLKEVGLHVQNMLTILGWIVNVIEEGGGGGGLAFNEHENL